MITVSGRRPSRRGSCLSRWLAAVVTLVALLTTRIGMPRAADPPARPPSAGINRGMYRDSTYAEPPEAALRRIVATALASGTIAEDSVLVDAFGRYGLEPLGQAQQAALRDGLDLFASALVQAQAPIYQPWWDIQALFLDHGTPQQRARMTAQLRRWFTEDVRGAPGVTATATDSPQAINGCRTSAAEILAEFRDRAAAPPIRAWLNQGSIGPDDRDRTLKALARLENPCNGRWLVVADSTGAALCPGAGLITVQPCRFINDGRTCGEPIPVESARYLARTIRLVPLHRARAPVADSLGLTVSAKSGFEVRLFLASDRRSIYLIERDMQPGGLAWHAESPELARWVAGYLKTVPASH